MKKIIALFALLFSLNAIAFPWFFGSDEATLLPNKIGHSTTAAEIDFTGGDIDLNPAATQSVIVNGGLSVVSTSLASTPAPSMTTAQRDALTGVDGQQIYNSDLKKIEYYDGAAWSSIDTQGGGQHKNFLDATAELYVDTDIWTCGSAPIFDDPGVSASISRITTGLIDTSDTANWEFTQDAGPGDDYCRVQMAVDEGKYVTFKMNYTYDGADSDMEMEYKCDTSGVVFRGTLLEAATSSTTYTELIFIPIGCGDLIAGFSVAVGNVGKIFQFNRAVYSSNLTMTSGSIHVTEWEAYTPTIAGAGTVSGLVAEWRRIGDTMEVSGKFTIGTSAAVESQISLPNSEVISSAVSHTLRDVGKGNRKINSASSDITILSTSGDAFVNLSANLGAGGNDGLEADPGNEVFGGSTLFSFRFTVPIQDWDVIAVNNLHSGVGTENTFSAIINVGLAGSGTFQPDSQNKTFIQDVVRNSTGNYTITFVAGFFGGVTPAIAGLSNTDQDFDVTYANLTATSVDILGALSQTASAPRDIEFSVFFQRQLTNYKDPKWDIIVPETETCFLSHREADTVISGTLNSGSYQTAPLNNIESGDCNWLSLSSSVITLSSGSYIFEGTGMMYRTNGGTSRVYNTTDSLEIGKGGFGGTGGAAGENAYSFPQGFATFTKATDVELQTFVQTTRATNGWGNHDAVAGGDEIYSQLKITKVK